MQTVQTQELELLCFTQPAAPGNAVDAAWPVYRDTGTASTATVYVVLEPGGRLPRHTDSAEEVLVVLEGEIEAVVGWERAHVQAGGLAVVPAMVPHEVACAGEHGAKLLGMFASNTIVSVFDDAFEQTGGRVVGTPPAPEMAHEPVASR